jgi:hypothetical protein
LSTTVFFSTSTDNAKVLCFSNVSTNNELNKNQRNQMFDWPLDNLHYTSDYPCSVFAHLPVTQVSLPSF